MKLNFRKIENKAGLLFLIIFSNFLLLSFSHTHQFNIEYNFDLQYNSTNETVSDYLLDTNFNCAIHTFSNSLRLEGIFKNNVILSNNYTINPYSSINLEINSLSKILRLRAPPFELV